MKIRRKREDKILFVFVTVRNYCNLIGILHETIFIATCNATSDTESCFVKCG